MADAVSGFTLTGTDSLSQVLFGVVLVIVVYLSLATGEYLYKSITRMYQDRIELFSDTFVSGPMTYSITQDPNLSDSKTIYPSDNQRSGIEFSYSLFIYVKSETFNTTDSSTTLYHILHKGYGQMYPLMGPGLFCLSNSNTLRVFMNCYDTWNSYTDIPNIPVDKWFHVVVSCKGNVLYVYINGNLKTKMTLSNNSPPYHNYGNVYAFSSRKQTLTTTITPSIDEATTGSSLVFNGPIKGMISRVYYFAYALTYSEIQTLVNVGPSQVINGNENMTISPYLSDTWWTNKNGP